MCKQTCQLIVIRPITSTYASKDYKDLATTFGVRCMVVKEKGE